MLSDLFRVRDWLILVPVGLVAIGLGIWGFSACDLSLHAAYGAGPIIFGLGGAAAKTIGLVFLRGMTTDACVRAQPWQLGFAQFLIPAVALIGAAKLFLLNLRRDVRVALAGRARDHVIVCGLGDTGRHAVEALLEGGHAVTAITLDIDHPNSAACERRGVAVLKGSSAQGFTLRHAGLDRAKAVVLSTGSDAQNLETALLIQEMMSTRQRAPLIVSAEVRSKWLIERLIGQSAAPAAGSTIDVRWINPNANMARLLLNSAAFVRFTEGVRPKSSPHLLLAGFDEFAAEFVQRCVCSAFALPGVSPRFTVFDADAAKARSRFELQSPSLAQLGVFAFQAYDFDLHRTADTAAEAVALPRDAADAVVISMASDDDALRAAVRFRNALDAGGRLAVPIFVRLKRLSKLGQLMGSVERHPFLPDRLVAFGGLAETTHPDVILGDALDRMARAAHQAYLTSLPAGAPFAAPWERLPEALRASNRNLADHLGVALRAQGLIVTPEPAPFGGLTDQECEGMAQAEHCRWLLERRADGWTFAETRNDALRQTPMLRPWSELDKAAKAFNRFLVRSFPDILALNGSGLRREVVIDLTSGGAIGPGSIPPNSDLAIRFDPADDGQWAAVGRGLATGRARLWPAWRGAASLSAIQAQSADPRVEAVFAGWIMED